MKHHLIKIAALALTLQAFIGCNAIKTNDNQQKVTSEIQKTAYTKRHVLTKAEQDALTPDQVLQEFKEGNERFNSGNVTEREHSEEIRKAATSGQFPKAMVLSCLDSRVPVEDIFDQGIGDVFVGRVAGNFVNTDLVGSMEFACKVAGAKLIIVMGHQHCGAVKGAIDDVQIGNIKSMVANIKPAVAMSTTFEGEKSSKNEAYVKVVAQNNIKNTIAQIRAKSEILKEMEAKGELKIVGVYYSLQTGKLEFVD
ncbi:MAG: carbonic anhydrase family protein [Flavobacterium sp.]